MLTYLLLYMQVWLKCLSNIYMLESPMDICPKHNVQFHLPVTNGQLCSNQICENLMTLMLTLISLILNLY